MRHGAEGWIYGGYEHMPAATLRQVAPDVTRAFGVVKDQQPSRAMGERIADRLHNNFLLPFGFLPQVQPFRQQSVIGRQLLGRLRTYPPDQVVFLGMAIGIL